MVKTAKIAISLPEDVLSTIEKERQARGESRSEFFRRAVELLLKQIEEAEAVEKYLEGYRRQPEIVSEKDPLYMAGLDTLNQEPW